MRWLIFCLLLTPSVVNCQLNLDYSYHAIAGCTVGLFAANTARKPLKATLVYSAGLGAAKELYDIRRGRRCDPMDIGATVLGGITGYAITQLLKRKNKHATRPYPRPLH